MAICKALDITVKVEYLAVTAIDGPTAVWSGETATYSIQVQNTGNISTSGILELYTHTPSGELIVLDSAAIAELAIDVSAGYTLNANTVGLSDASYSVCAKTDFEGYT